MGIGRYKAYVAIDIRIAINIDTYYCISKDG
nr:MAG TPA: hypothetical protein [Caudoviricetes sp.]